MSWIASVGLGAFTATCILLYFLMWSALESSAD